MSLLVAPSILSANFARLGEEVHRAETAQADWIHVDVMDGHFVPNLTIGAPVVKCLRGTTKLPLDVHLMITDPDRYLSDFAEAGADYITVHQEACTHLQRTLSHIRTLGKKAGVALNPATPESTLKYVLGDLDLILVMSVNPGFGGQKFLMEVLPKITALRAMLDQAGNPQCRISVDGGINPETARLVAAAGASVVVAGNAVYGAPDINQAIADIKGARTAPAKSGGRVSRPVVSAEEAGKIAPNSAVEPKPKPAAPADTAPHGKPAAPSARSQQGAVQAGASAPIKAPGPVPSAPPPKPYVPVVPAAQPAAQGQPEISPQDQAVRQTTRIIQAQKKE